MSEDNSKYIEIDLNDQCFDWSIKQKDKVDWTKLQYSTHYKSFDFFDSRFTGDYSHIPGFDIIIEKMVENALTPYEEMQHRIYDSLLYNDDERNDTSFSEFKDSR